jgi:hypothetical protein
LDGEEKALDVAVEDAVEVLFIDRAERSVSGDASVGKDDVESAFSY